MFDPFGWFNKFIPERTLHLIVRLFMAAVTAVFLIKKIIDFKHFLIKPLWAAETAIFLILVAAFIARKEPVSRSVGAKEIIVPLIGAVMPFGLLFSPPSDLILKNQFYLKIIFWWMTFATIVTVWGMWTLKRSFSITVEARSVANTGPYKWIRHPIYLGEILAAAAVAGWRYSAVNIFLFLAFAAIQFMRARWEEQKLEKVFPEYTELKKSSWWFWLG